MTIESCRARVLITLAGITGAFLFWKALATWLDPSLSSLTVLITLLAVGATLALFGERVRRRQRSLLVQHQAEAATAITAIRQAQGALLASEARYRAAFHTSLDAMAICSLISETYLELNESFLTLTGYRRDEVVGKTARELGLWLHYRERKEMTESLQRKWLVRDLEFKFKRKNGQIFCGIFSASTVVVDGESCVFSVLRDISAWKTAQEEIRKLGMYDSLTVLPNRRLLRDRLGKSIAFSAKSHRKRALLFLDLDDFKRLNDNLGHQIGDLLLREVASRIKLCVRAIDTVGRLGGDEFVVLLEELSENPETAAAEAEALTEKILTAIDQPYQLGGHECASSCSIGITVFGGGQENVDEILQQAEIAMYQAKGAGRNAIRFFASELQATVNARALLEEELRIALKKGLLSVYYQPQVEHGRLIGAEALVRWNHPRLGLLAASDFIDLAEETRLILPLGNWVLESVCKQIADWSASEDTAGITVAVNISALQLRRGDFVHLVSSALGQSGANPRKLKLELTETVLMDRVEDVITKMTTLKSMGLSFSLDDFGTGYSSLAYLKRFPLDQVKIDRSFVRDIPTDVGSGAIAQAIISLSRAMGLAVIAEGVETEQQRSFLAALGCDSCQGYLYGEPLPLAQFEPFARTAMNSTLEAACHAHAN